MKNEKLDFLNLIKLLIILPGVVYHVSEYLIFPEPLIVDNFLIKALYSYSRFFYYTAFIATIAVFYPLGLNLSKKVFNTKRTIIAITGLIFLSIVYYESDAPFFNTEWTFYHFVLSSFLILHFGLSYLKNKSINYAVLFISFIMLWIPFWKFDLNDIPYSLKIALIGDCKNTDYGEWPLLPWFFLTTLSVSYCVTLESYQQFKKISNLELSLWLVTIFSLGIPFWGAYYSQPSDTNFSCGVFARPNWIFYAHILPYFFIIRLNYVSSIRTYLTNNAFFIGLRNISWVNNFGTCYLLSLLTIGGLNFLYDGSMFEPGMKHLMYLISVAITLIVPEIITRALKKFKSNN